jgi:choline transporter-like protein 2/4/5
VFQADTVPSLNYFFMPVIFIVVGSFFITSSFFTVYSMAVDTLFLCFLEDLERNDGTPER